MCRSILRLPVQPGQGGADILPGEAPALQGGGQPLERGPVRGLAPELGGQKPVNGLLRVRHPGQGVVPQLPGHPPVLQLLAHPAGP